MHVKRYAVAPSVDKNARQFFFFQLKKQASAVKKTVMVFAPSRRPALRPAFVCGPWVTLG
jgi:hypothetical protein